MSQPTHFVAGSATARRAALAGALVVLAVALLGSTVDPAQAAQPPRTYTFDVLASLPQTAPGIPGKFLTRDFELGGLNESASGIWGADFGSTSLPVAPSEGEGVYINRHGGPPELIARSGGTDPEGVTFFGAQGSGFLSPVSINNSGDGAMGWLLLPAPTGGADARLNSGLYRYEHSTGQVITIAKSGSPAPGGGLFEGFNFGVSMNGRGDVAFHGITKTTAGTYTNPANGSKYGVGLYIADNLGNISALVVPGDPAPGGGNFDNVRNAWLNDRGDITFGGHTTADPACTSLSCAESVYLLPSNGSVISVAHKNDVAPVSLPGVWTYNYAFGPRINNAGDLVFVGCVQQLPASACGTNRGVFVYRDGAVESVVSPGQVFQAEGDTYTAVRASNIVNNYFINDYGDVVFTLQYDADVNGDTYKDSGVFTWSRGVYEVVAKTGDSIPGVGTMRHAEKPAGLPTASAFPTGYSVSNNRGQVMFQVTLADGSGALLLATP